MDELARLSKRARARRLDGMNSLTSGHQPIRRLRQALRKKMSSNIVQSVMSDPRNLATCYEQELAWKRGSLKTGHFYLQNLTKNGPKARRFCGGVFVDLCREFAAEHGRIPSLLDVGCGPVTSYAYLVYEGLANVVGVDPLASRYSKLLADFGLESPAEQLDGAGEWLDDVMPEREFDIVTTQNSLDHHQCPALAWLRMFEHTRVGGYLAQSHSIREATKEGWKQLHQYDLYPDEDHIHLWLDDGRGKDLCLTNSLPLEKVFSTANHNDDGTGWFTSVYQKHDTSVPDDYYSRVLEHAAHSLKKRHEWALDLESLIESQFRSYK